MSILSLCICSTFTAEKLDVLKSHKVVTSLDFLQYNNERLTSIMGITVSDVIKIKEKILESNNIQPLRADKLCDLRLQSTLLLASGINNWLGGGIPTGTITEIFGLPSTGKSWMASNLSAHVCSKQKLKASYITSCDTKAESIVKLLQKFCKQGESNLKESLQRLVFTPVFDVYQLMEALWNPNMSSYKLIIVDSLATLFMPILGGSSNDGDNCFDSNLLIFSSFNMLKAISLLNKVASDLKRIAVVHRCAVLVINHEAKQKSEEPIPALGRYWLSVPNLRLHCKRLNASEIELSIVRNVYCPDVEPKCKFTFSEVEVESTSVQSSSACSRSAT